MCFMQPLVSVIVIAFNAEGTIARCIDSILAQSFHNFELVVIDDGSTDGTYGIVSKYLADDKRIKAVRQDNSGVAAARQKGLESAQGLYSIFVDSDDWIEPDMLESMYSRAIEDSADMVLCDYVEENGLGTFYRKQEPKSTSSAAVLEQMMVDLHGSLCTKLIKASLYKESGISFIPGLNYCEDECVVIRLLGYGCRVSYINKAFYHYDKLANAGSVSNLWAYRPVNEYELFISSCEPVFNTPELKRNLDERVAAIIKKLTYSPKEKYKECRGFYHRHRQSLLNSDMSLPKKLFCILYFNGFRFIARLRDSFQINS